VSEQFLYGKSAQKKAISVPLNGVKIKSKKYITMVKRKM